MKNLVLCLLVLISVAASAQTQPPTLAAPTNSLYVSAEGKFEAQPDTALIQFDISAQENNSRAAYERGTRAAEQIRELLRANGIDPKTAEIGFFSLTPVYDYRDPKRKVVAFRANSNVTLKLKDFSKVAPITEALANLDVTANQNISYTLDNIDAAKIRAVQDAFQRARAEASALAQAGTRTLGELIYGSIDTHEEIRPMVRVSPGMMAAETAAARKAATEEFAPQRITVTARVNALFSLR